MTPQNLFPTFARWYGAANPPGASLWRLRGPTWYTTTWWHSDSLAAMQLALLRILAVAHAERLELAPLVDHFASEHRGRYRRCLMRFARRLATGTALVPALEQTPDVLGDDMVLALRLGSQSGTLAATYQQLIQSEQLPSDERKSQQQNMVAYWIVLALTLVTLLTLLATVIAPTFKKIGDEFGTRFPESFLLLISILQMFGHYAWFWLGVMLIAAWLCWSATARRFFRRTLATQFFHQFAESRRVELLRILALAVESGRPLAGTLSTLARYHFDRHMRQKLLFARNEVEQGEELWKSLADARVISMQEAQAVQSSPTKRTQAWTLRSLAANKQQTISRNSLVRFALLQPIVVLSFASIVLWVCYAFLSVVTQFIHGQFLN